MATTKEVAALNDKLRAQLPFLPQPHRTITTPMVQAMDPDKFVTLVAKIKAFDTFDSAVDDPHGEHDFISVDLDGEMYFAKIDYYDRNLEYFDQSNSGVRVFTIMHSREY